MPRKAAEAAAKEKTAAKKITTRRTKKASEPIVLTWEDIATRAYYIHLEEGGNADENWVRAERELAPA